MKGCVLILGATSAIARCIADRFASNGHEIYLAGRDLQELERRASDLEIRHQVRVHSGFFDATSLDTHPKFFSDVLSSCNALEGVVIAFGDLGKHESAVHDAGASTRLIEANFTGAVSILTPCADHLESSGSGFIIGLSSVAGDRGRQSNYIYGSAKAGLSAYLQGLRNRLYPAGVHVLTVKPGFVDTAMTFGMPGMFLVAQPSQVADSVVHALERRKNVVYTPWFWRWIMLIIRSVPESIFKRLKL